MGLRSALVLFQLLIMKNVLSYPTQDIMAYIPLEDYARLTSSTIEWIPVSSCQVPSAMPDNTVMYLDGGQYGSAVSLSPGLSVVITPAPVTVPTVSVMPSVSPSFSTPITLSASPLTLSTPITVSGPEITSSSAYSAAETSSMSPLSASTAFSAADVSSVTTPLASSTTAISEAQASSVATPALPYGSEVSSATSVASSTTVTAPVDQYDVNPVVVDDYDDYYSNYGMMPTVNVGPTVAPIVGTVGFSGLLPAAGSIRIYGMCY